MITYIFSHDPKGPEELSFRLKRKCSSICHFSDPWGQKEGKLLNDSGKFPVLPKYLIFPIIFPKLKYFTLFWCLTELKLFLRPICTACCQHILQSYTTNVSSSYRVFFLPGTINIKCVYFRRISIVWAFQGHFLMHYENHIKQALDAHNFYYAKCVQGLLQVPSTSGGEASSNFCYRSRKHANVITPTPNY